MDCASSKLAVASEVMDCIPSKLGCGFEELRRGPLCQPQVRLQAFACCTAPCAQTSRACSPGASLGAWNLPLRGFTEAACGGCGDGGLEA